MRLVVFAAIVVWFLAMGALEIYAARGVSDADVPGGASVSTWAPRQPESAQ